MSVKVVTKATKAIEEQFPGAVVQSQKLDRPGQYALMVISDRFARKSPYRRQVLVWDILDKALTGEEFLKISFVFPLLPSEVAEKPAPARTRKKVVSTRQTLAKS